MTATLSYDTAAPTQHSSKRADWFDTLIQEMRTHQKDLALGTADGETRHFYDVYMSGNLDKMAAFNMETARQHFATRLLTDYLSQVYHLPFRTLAFSFYDFSLLVWVEINDDDEVTENTLVRIGSKILAKYDDYGFKIEEMIVETSEKLPVPSNYTIFKTY